MKPAHKLPRRLRRVEPRFLEGNRIRRLGTAQIAFEAMLSAIEGARRQVLFEMYWFAGDGAGRMFAAALTHAAARGVEVALLYDSLGSIGTGARFFQTLREQGVHVEEYNPLAPWHQRFQLAGLTRRDHRKCLIVDAEIGITGGVNIGNEWLPESRGGGGWYDECVEIEGPAVQGFSDAFFEVWNSQDGPPLTQLKTPSAARGTQRALVLTQPDRRRRREIIRTYLRQIWHAEQRVWLVNSYFLPDGRVVRALCAAADRGVDVRVLLPGISDVVIVQWASRAMWGKLLRHGVRIYELQRRVLHSKTAVIDGTWSTVGSFNLDYRSIRHNLEVTVSIDDRTFSSEMEQAFLIALGVSQEIKLSSLGRRSLRDRILDGLLYRLRFLL